MKLFDPFFSFFINLFKLCLEFVLDVMGFELGDCLKKFVWTFETCMGQILLFALESENANLSLAIVLTIFCVLTLLVNIETKTHLRCMHIKKNTCDDVYWFACLFVYDFCMCVLLFRSYFVSIVIYFGNFLYWVLFLTSRRRNVSCHDPHIQGRFISMQQV